MRNSPPPASPTPGFHCLRLLALGLVVGSALLRPVSGLEPGVARPAGYRSDRVIVRTHAADPGELQRLHAQLGTRTLHTLGNGGGRPTHVLGLPPGLSVAQAVEALGRNPAVQFVEPDYLLTALRTPNDFQYLNQDQWNLHNTGIYGGVAGADIMAEAAWDLQTDASAVVVAVVDSGVRYTHEDLAGNMWVNPGESGTDGSGRDKRSNGIDDDGNGYVDDVHGINVLNGTGNPMDDWGHGTHVAGIIGAVTNNNVGIAGVAWRVKIMACKFISADAQYSVSDAIKCLEYARTHGAKIVNASWGGYAFTSTALRDAINTLRNSGIIVTAAVGNDNNNNDAMPLYPASYDADNIVAVAATDRTDARAGYSNYGASTVDLGAPGSPVFSAWAGSDRDYRYNEGTSMSAPHAAGACALLWARFPNDTYAEIIQRVLANVDPLGSLAGRTKTGGRLNLAAALASGGSQPPPTAPAAPSGLSASATSSSSISLTWVDNSAAETGFEVQRATDGSTFSSSGTTGANVTSLTVTGLNAGTTYTFRVRALQGAASSEFSNVSSATTSPSSPPPPGGGWTSLDVGAVAAPGATSEANGAVTLSGSGEDIWNRADEFRFHYQAWSGDGEIIARLTSLTQTDNWAKGGVMFRESLAANSRHVLMCITAANGSAFQRRTASGGESTSTSGWNGSSLPRWVRLVRSGDTFRGYESLDGRTWNEIGSATVAMSSTLYIGLAVTSHRDGTLCSAVFDNVTTSGGSTPPPPPSPTVNAPSALTAATASASQIDLTWADNSGNETGFELERSTDQVNFSRVTATAADVTRFSDPGRSASTTYYYRVRAVSGSNTSTYSNIASATTASAPPPPSGEWQSTDVGPVGSGGSHATSGATITVRASGADIWEQADSFHFVYRAVSGDCTIETQVSSLAPTHSWAKAGVMLRESLDPGARNVFALVTAGNGVGAQVRASSGGPTAYTAGPWGSAAPYWLRVVRAGNRVTVFISPDRATWSQLNAYDFAAGPTLYVGLAVTAHDNSQVTTAVFTDAAIR